MKWLVVLLLLVVVVLAAVLGVPLERLGALLDVLVQLVGKLSAS